MNSKIIISKEDINNTLSEWGFVFFEELEKDLGRELKPEEYKKALLHCLGYVDYSKKDKLDVLDDLDISECLSDEEIRKLK